jgi:hypothetical protein
MHRKFDHLVRAGEQRRGNFEAEAPRRPDCVAGHVRLELRNVVANYPFERSHRFLGIRPNSGHRDHSRVRCGAGIRSSALMGFSSAVIDLPR